MRRKLFNVFLVCLFCLTVPAVAFAQQAIKVTGKVIDSTNEGVPGVNVSVKGGSLGTITDIDGNYLRLMFLTLIKKTIGLFFYWLCKTGNSCGKQDGNQCDDEG